MKSAGAGLALLCLLASWCSAQETRPVAIGTVSGQLVANETANSELFSSYLDANIPGYRFEVVSFNTIETLIAAVDAGQVDFAFITPVAYVQLSQRHELRPLATVTQQVEGSMYPWLASSVFVRADRSELATLGDVSGDRVMALSPLALGGWLAALREWRALGIDETQDFAELVFDFSYLNVVQAVCNGRTDIGVLPTSTFLQNRASCSEPLRVLTLDPPYVNPRFPFEFSTRVYPEVAFALVGVVDEALVNQLTMALLAIRQGSAEAAAINVAGFTAPLSYVPVAELMQELQVAPFEGYGEVTLNQVLQQHRGKLAMLMFFIAAVLVLAYVRNFLLQRKVKQSELFRNQIFTRSQFAVVIVDARTLDFVDVNAAAITLLGFNKREDVIGKSPLMVLADIQYDGREISENLESMRNMMERDDGPLVIEWLLKRPNGELWDAEGHIVPFTYGNGQFIQVTLVDVTERKRIVKEREKMEQQLRHSQRLESIGRFSGAIAHDFNNLLTVINGYSELLLLNAEEDDPQRNIYREITQACSRAGDLTNQLLTFSRRRIARMEPLDVNKIITDSASMFRRLLGETITLSTALSTNLGLTMADTGQLHQVLMNFVVNARDAMPGGGEFYLATERCQIDARAALQLNIEAGDYIRLSVRDTGVGMSKEVQDKVFEPFFTTKGDRGNGFGLATAYGIVKQCRGGITFQSDLGVGTTFTLYLPVTENLVDTRPAQAAPLTQLSSGPRTVLVVEDEREVRIFACLLLQTAGFKVLEAESGVHALKLAQTHRGPIDLMFTDVVLGDISGSKLAEKFKLLFPTTPVLFTSGYANDEIALHGVMQDRIAFIAKPYSPATLLTKIRTLFEQSTPVA